jgi:regulator of sirC expression with transglutaminase-like and TPR domain
MHFLVHYDDGSRSFLLDPFNGGTVITRQECEAMVSTNGKPLPSSAYLPVTNREMIERMLRNLFVANQQNGEHDEAGRLGRLIAVINPEFRVNTSPESDPDSGDMDSGDDA